MAVTKAEAITAIHERVWREVSEGGGEADVGQGQPTGVLRLPGRALAAHPDDEPDRIEVRNGAVTGPCARTIKSSITRAVPNQTQKNVGV